MLANQRANVYLCRGRRLQISSQGRSCCFVSMRSRCSQCCAHFQSAGLWRDALAKLSGIRWFMQGTYWVLGNGPWVHGITWSNKLRLVFFGAEWHPQAPYGTSALHKVVQNVSHNHVWISSMVKLFLEGVIFKMWQMQIYCMFKNTLSKSHIPIGSMPGMVNISIHVMSYISFWWTSKYDIIYIYIIIYVYI